MKKERLIQQDVKRDTQHPLSMEVIVSIVLQAWNDIQQLTIGSQSYCIGKDFLPKPQLVGMLLHELIAMEIGRALPGKWKGDEKKIEKDLVYLPDDTYSIEIKTSSSDNGVFGNRSYVKSENGKKLRGSYYLIVNFENFTKDSRGFIKKIRFGYLEREDWIAQTAESGQQCRLSKEAKKTKLLEIYNYKH